MSFLRLGTSCVVMNTQDEVLLSLRGDLQVWNLPGGRLDYGECLQDAAAREVHEETGIEVEIERIVGLYYITRWQRCNVVYRAHPIGGSLLTKTHETLDNAWFPLTALPELLTQVSRLRIHQALEETVFLHVINTPLAEYRRLRRKFAVRWIQNILRGRPEPRYPRFDIWAAAVSTGKRVLCGGKRAPWEELGQPVNQWQWVGLREDAANGKIEFYFETK